MNKTKASQTPERKVALQKLIEMTPAVREAVLQALLKKRQAALSGPALQPNLDQVQHNEWLVKQSDAQLDNLAQGISRLAHLKAKEE